MNLDYIILSEISQSGKDKYYTIPLILCISNIQKTKIMASSPITSWEIDGKQWKQWQTLFFGGSKTTSDGDFSHEIKRCLLLGRKAMANIDSILKSRDITLLTKVYIVKAMAFLSNHVQV